MTVEITSQGVRKNYGPRRSEHQVPSIVRTAGNVNQLEVAFDYDSLPTTSELDNLVDTIGAGAFIVSSRLNVREAFVGGTNLTVGLSQPDGTVIDADGLHAAILTAALTDNSWHVGAGALVGATIGANDAQLTVTASGTFTAGKATLIVEFIPDQG